MRDMIGTIFSAQTPIRLTPPNTMNAKITATAAVVPKRGTRKALSTESTRVEILGRCRQKVVANNATALKSTASHFSPRPLLM